MEPSTVSRRVLEVAMSQTRRLCLCTLLVGAAALAAGQSGRSSDARATAENPGKDATEASTSGALEPCRLLTGEQVTTVLPEHDDGFAAKRGGSLIEGVDAYQCSYSSASGDLLTVILNVAVDADRFEKIKPSGFAMGSDARELEVGDGGWLRGEEDDMKVTVLKGLTVIDLELLAADAGQKGDALVELARRVASKAP
jgi:hypothetical protein